jgi:hypothetical protein
MADNPVIFDDGGSTRLRKLMRGGGVGDMPSLLEEPQPNVPSANRDGLKQEVIATIASYGTIAIAYIDSQGAATTVFGPAPFQSFEIVSGVHKVTAALFPNASPIPTGFMDLRIFVHGPAGIRPIVEAKQHKGRRRYTVSNAPTIDTVSVTNAAGVTILAFDSANPPAGTRPVVYTSVVVT